MAYPQKESISKSSLLDYIYPINSIYISMSSNDPSLIFPNTAWERMPDGLLRCAYFSSDGSVESIGTGGATSHNHTASKTSLTSNDLPYHKHSGFTRESGSHIHNNKGYHSAQYGSQKYSLSRFSSGDQNTVDFGMNPAGDHNHTFTLNEEGANEGHTHTIGDATSLPPYIKVNVWKRTA